MVEASPDRKKGRLAKRVAHVQAMREHLADNDAVQTRTEALQMARAVALAGLPKRRTTKRDLARTLRLGQDLWLRVIYTTTSENTLPYGEDRFVLAAIQTLALEQGNPIVFLEDLSHLLRMFDRSTDGRTFTLLQERLRRLKEVSIRFRFAQTEEGLEDAPAGQQMFIVEEFFLPSSAEALGQKIVQLGLPFEVSIPSKARYAVLLSDKFWKVLQTVEERLILPMELMKRFIDAPTGWDYASFLVYRCGRAQTPSIVPHDALMSLFKDSERENDGQTIKRLLKYHGEILETLDGRLDATLEQVGYFPSSGGRPKERWQLRVGPSKQIIWSGKQQELFPVSGS